MTFESTAKQVATTILGLVIAGGSEKACTKCGEIKPLHAFGPLRQRGRPWCRACGARASQEYYHANKARINAMDVAKYASNPEPKKANGIRRYAADPTTAKQKAIQWTRANRGAKKVYSATRQARKISAPGRGINRQEWATVLADACGICAYCGRSKALTLDHIDPLVLGGGHDIGNAVAACQSCNSSKSGSPLLLWLARRALRRNERAA